MLNKYKANITTGSGKDLPALLGLLAMQGNDAAITLRKGKKTLVMPGPGECKMEWPRDAKPISNDQMATTIYMSFNNTM